MFSLASYTTNVRPKCTVTVPSLTGLNQYASRSTKAVVGTLIKIIIIVKIRLGTVQPPLINAKLLVTLL